MNPADRREAELDERDRRLVAEAPPLRPEAIELLRSLNFPFNRKKQQQEQAS